MTSRTKIIFAAGIAVLAATTWASAQSVGVNGATPGSSSIVDAPVAPQPSAGTGGVSSAPGAATVSPGIGTTGMGGGRSQPSAPNTTVPGTIGTGASPSGLPGDNPNAPGFPGKVGQ